MADAAPALHRAEPFHGLPSHRLTLPGGDAVQVLEHGAHVVSWTAAGRERLFMSSRARYDGRSALRGGVPVCFPQFNQRGPLPKHGFVRTRPWSLARVENDPVHGASLTMRLQDDAATRALWPQAFRVELTVSLRPGALDLLLDVHNTGAEVLSFTGALHTYLRVDDVARATLQGLGGRPEWDAVRDVHGLAADVLHFGGEFDRVYGAPDGPLTLGSTEANAGGTSAATGPAAVGAPVLRIDHGTAWAETVVWTPGAALAASMPDLPPAEAAQMLCVEAAQVMQPVQVPPGWHWQGSQGLRLP